MEEWETNVISWEEVVTVDGRRNRKQGKRMREAKGVNLPPEELKLR